MSNHMYQEVIFNQDAFNNQLNYWLKVLGGELQFTQLPFANLKPLPVTGYREIETIPLNLSGGLAQRLLDFSKNSDLALYVVLLTGFKVLLFRTTMNDDMVITSPRLRLNKAGEDETVYNRRVIFRDEVNQQFTFRELLLKTRDQITGAYKNQDYPLDLVFKKLGSTAAEIAAFDRIGFLLRNIHAGEDLAGLNLDIQCSFIQESGKLEGAVGFNRKLFSPEMMSAFVEKYLWILEACLQQIDERIKDLPVLSESEQRKLLYEFNQTQADYPRNLTIHHLFEKQAARTPFNTAIQFGEETLTYQELNKRSNQLAGILRKKGLGPDRIVGLLIDNSLEMIIGILGILKAGGSYLPIRPDYPLKRIQTMLNDSGARYLLTKDECIKDFSFNALQCIESEFIQPVITAARSQFDDLDCLQPPDRSLVNYEKYRPYIGQAMVKNSITLQFSRGCAFHCAYCFKIWSQKYVIRSAENIFHEMLMYYNMGIRRFAFVDDLPNINIAESTKLYQLIIDNGLKVHLHYPNGIRGDILTKDYIDLMVAAGTVNMDLALETTSPRLQKLIQKNLNLERLKENVQYIIDKHPQVILELQILHGIPSETEAEAEASLDFIKSLQWIHFPYIHVLKIYPHTKMAQIAMEHGISAEAIERSANLGYHELPETLPFPKSFTRKYQSEFLNEYFLSRKRLLKILPYQMKVLTEDELVQKYHSYLPVEIKNFSDLLDYVGICRSELEGEFLPANFGVIDHLNEKISSCFPVQKDNPNALRILLLDISQFFSHESNMIYDVVEPPLGLMYLMTHLKKCFGDQVFGKIAKSRIDFDDYSELQSLIADFKPDLIGIRTLNFYRDFFHKMVSLLRQWGINVPIIAGGPYATSNYTTLLNDWNIDLAVLGEGEATFEEIIAEIIDNERKLPGEEVLANIAGLAFIPQSEKQMGKNDNRQIILLDRLAGVLTEEPDDNPENINNPADLAYIIFTSGSTGNPKGVMIQHNNLVNQITGLIRRFAFDASLRYILLADFTFDVSVMHIFTPLVTGAKLFIIPNLTKKDPIQFWQFVAKNQINVLNIVPAFMEVLLKNFTREKIQFKYLFVGGDVFSKELYLKLKETFDAEKIINIYGPTETTINATLFECNEADPGEVIPIGKPLANYKAYILDRDYHPVPVGVPGELYLAGDGVARGYLNRGELNKERFVTLLKSGERMYRTGDYAQWRPDGNIEFIGRIDHQVKIRGFRIELGEIENQLRKYALINEAVVIDRIDQTGNKNLIAYFTVNAGMDIADLRQFLAQQLPDYMVPSYFVELEKIPLNINGKIDRNALPQPDRAQNQGQNYEPPEDEMERALVKIWQEILGVTRIGVRDNFFDFGGHSLKAAVLVSRIHQTFGAEIPLVEVFKNPTIKAIAAYLKQAVKNVPIFIPPVAEKEYYSLSSSQNRIYILNQLDNIGISYNMPLIMIIAGELEWARFVKAFELLIQRHEALRTYFEIIDGVAVQKILPNMNFTLDYTESGADELTIDQRIGKFIQPFNLKQWPLIRAGLVRLAKDKHLFLFDIHHIISDGLSLNVLMKDFSRLYCGQILPELKIQYKDFAERQKELLKHEEFLKQEAYWLNQFSGEIPVLNLLTDYPRPYFQSFEGATLSFGSGPELKAKLNWLASETGATLYMILLAAYNILLMRYTGQEDIIIGSPVSGRTNANFEEVIGIFINTLALRNYPQACRTFRDFLAEVKDHALEAYSNQDYPFEELVNQLNLPRDLGRNPLFNVMFEMLQLDQNGMEVDGLKFLPYEFETTIAKFDITLGAFETTTEISFRLEYCRKLFQRDTITLLAGHYLKILTEICDNPDLKIFEIEILSETEKAELIFELNHTQAPYPKEKTILRLFEEQVARTPDNIGLIFGDKRITYGELNVKAGQLARILRQKGVNSESIVGIMVKRCPEMIIGIFGILKAGGAYLPIDPEYPAERIRYIIEDSQTPIVLVRQESAFPWLTKEQIRLDEAGLYAGEFSSLEPVNIPNNLAYIIYTSGSTGKPKGVMIEHYSLVNRLHWMQKQYPLDLGDVILQKTPYTFDVSLWELFWWSFTGARLAILEPGGEKDPAAIVAAIEKHQVTTIHFVPSMLNAFLEYLEGNTDFNRLRSLKQIFASGEALTGLQVKKFRRLIGNEHNVNLHNLYGPTEATVDVSYFDCSAGADMENIPIGKPIDNTRFYIINEYYRLQPVGVPGELCISGDCLARGYLNRLELTGEKFVPNPFYSEQFRVKSEEFRVKSKNQNNVCGLQHLTLNSTLSTNEDSKLSTLNSQLMYKTGDLARRLPDGNIEFLGRMDHQVKIRGNRIELGEIEARLMKHEAVKEAVVTAKDDLNGPKYLCAYWTGDRELTVQQLRSHLAQTLPDYMIPSFFMQLEKLPLTPSGKVDRKQLPEPEGKIKTTVEYEAPRNATEAELTDLWQEILGIRRIGINDNFFELGGHSLKATVLVSKVHQLFNSELSLREIFANPTVKEQAAYLRGAAENLHEAIQPVLEWKGYPSDCYPVSSAQKRLYILHQFDKDQINYNMPGAAIFEGGLDPSRLEAVFGQLIRRHESLRTSFEVLEGVPVQRIHPEIEFRIDYRAVEEDQVTGAVKEFIRPFDLSQGPLFRVGLLELSPVKHLLIYDMHHIISDGVSLGLIIREFISLYQGRKLAALPIQYKDYAVWQYELFQNPVIKLQEEYWVRCFSDEVPILNFPTDFPRPATQSFAGDQVRLDAGPDMVRGIDRLVAATGTTPFMILLAAYNILLSKYSGQEDIVIGSPIAGRPHADLEMIIGMFVNTLALRNYPSGDKNFTRFLAEVKENSLKAFENQDYPFEELVEALELRRDLSRNPLFDVMFVLQTDGLKELETGVLKFSVYDLKSAVSKFDITLNALKTDHELKLVIDYCVNLFQKDTMERFGNHLLQIITQITENPEITLTEISLLTAPEKRRILEDFNHTTAHYADGKTIQEMFEEQAGRTPDSRAVLFGERSLTYRELNQRANQLARTLRKRGIHRDHPVGIMVERSLEMIIGIMAILKAGGAYLPIDPHLPEDRIAYMLDDSGARVLLTISRLSGKISFHGELFAIDATETFADEDFENLDRINESTDLAYVIYTSGSTGNPKGAMIEHHSVINRLQWMQKKYPLNETDVILQKTPYTFDVSVWELFWWSWVGATVCFLGPGEEKNPEAIIEAVDQYRVTTMHFVPSMLNTFLEYLEGRGGIGKLSGLRRVFTSGEALQSYQVQKFNHLLKRHHQTGLHNLYGPTEATVDVSYYDCPDGGVPEAIPIGKPIDNTYLYILDQNRQLQPVKIPGELFISGAGVGRGYLNRPELTLEKFTADPFRPGARMYRTGDMARWLPDGNIEYLGRTDFQVKIRGFRIELGEIKAGLLKQAGVKDAAVVARESATGEKYLCAYVVGEGELGISRIKDQLARELPSYMIPRYIMQLAQMPLSRNGKLDRKQLPEPDSRLGIETEYVAPENEREAQLARIWMELLAIGQVGMNDNFFELGGHSLKATALVLKIREELNIEVSLKEVFQNQTIRTLASSIANRDQNSYQVIQPVARREYYPVSSAQMRTFVANQHFMARTSYNMPGILLLEGKLDRFRLEKAFQALIQRHETFRTGFELRSGEPVQIISQNVIFRMDYCKIEPEFHFESEKALATQEMHKFIQPFNLSQAPLLRVKLIELAPARHLLCYDMHHIIADGASMNIMIGDLAQLYNGQELPESKIQYKDFTIWQNDFFNTEAFQRQERYWLERFSGEIPVLDLPVDYPRPSVRTYEGDNLHFEMGPDLVAGFNKIAIETDATLFMVLLAAYNILLAKYSNREDVIIGTNIAGRSHPDLNNIIGMFTNTLVLRNFPKAELSFRDFLAEVRNNALEGYDNQDYPFEKLLGRLNLKRDPSRNPLVETVLSFQDFNDGLAHIPDLQMIPYEFEHKIARMDLLVILTQTATSLHGIVEYSTRIFKPARIEMLKQNYLEILAQIVRNPEMKLGEIAISSGLLVADTDASQINTGEFDF